MNKNQLKKLLIKAGYKTEVVRVIKLEDHCRLLNSVIKKAGGIYWLTTDGLLWNVLMCIDFPSQDIPGHSYPKNISIGNFYLTEDDKYDIDELADELIELNDNAEKVRESLPTKEEIEEIKTGTVVETCDGRYGIVRGVDWHAKKFLGRGDYQIKFPTGVGIFRRDEFKVVNLQNIEPASKEPNY